MSEKKEGEIIFQEKYAREVWEKMKSLKEKTIEIEKKLNVAMEDYTQSEMKGECAKELNLRWKHLFMNINNTMNDLHNLQQEVINAASIISDVDLLVAKQIKSK